MFFWYFWTELCVSLIKFWFAIDWNVNLCCTSNSWGISLEMALHKFMIAILDTCHSLWLLFLWSHCFIGCRGLPRIADLWNPWCTTVHLEFNSCLELLAFVPCVLWLTIDYWIGWLASWLADWLANYLVDCRWSWLAILLVLIALNFNRLYCMYNCMVCVWLCVCICKGLP